MDTIKINVSSMYNTHICIGRQSENDVTQVVFDLTGWIQRYGLGTVALSVMRQGDLRPYPVPIAIDADGMATWTVSATDTEQRGNGKIQLTYYVDSKIKKSVIYALHVRDSLQSDGPAPQPYESWLEVLQELTAETTANAQSASQSAQSASQSAQSAGASAASAASEAQAASTAAESASQSETNAEHYAELAAQSASRAGYAIFDVDESTGEAVVSVSDAVDEAMTFAVDEANGDLEVTLV